MIRLLTFVAILAPVLSQSCSVLSNTAKQVPQSSIAPGNTYFGFILPVHRPEVTSGAVCGPISNKDVIKAEAFFYALRTYADRWDVTGVTAQAGIVFDSCASADRIYENLASVELGKPNPPPEVVNVLAYLIADKHSVAVRISKLFSRQNITVISSSLNDPGTPVTLSNTFYHMSPTAQQEASAILKLLNRSKWRYVQVMYTNDGYGRQVYNAFLAKAEADDVTVGRSEMIDDDGLIPDLDSYPFVVVVFAYDEQKMQIFKEMGNKQLIFVTTNLGHEMPAGEGMSYNSRIVELRTSVEDPKYAMAVQQFTEYVKSLTKTGTRGTTTPWYSEFWENYHKCDINGAGQADFNRSCNNTVTLGNFKDIDPREVALIIQGVDMMLKALKMSCNGICSPGTTLENRRNQFNSNFKKVGFEETAIFDRTTLGPQTWRYNVHLLSWDDSQNRFVDAEVGHIGDKTISIDNLADIAEGRVMYTGQAQIVARSTMVDEEYGTRFDVWGYIWVIVIGVLASLGILLVLIIAILLCVLKGKAAMSNYVWLYAVLLFGAFLGYLTLYAYIPIPTTSTCGIIRFGVGLSYGMCFSVMVVLGLLLCKKSEMFSSERVSNIFIAVSLILLITIELVILVTWMIWTPPGVSYLLYPGYMGPRRICNHYTLGPGNTFLRTAFENHLLHLIYIMFLILLVLILAIFIFMRRKNLRASRNKKESLALLATGIGTGLGTVAIWLAWTLVGALVTPTYGDVHNFSDAAMAFGLWFTLTWLLIFLLIQVINTWRGASRSKAHRNEMKVNLSNMNHHQVQTTENNYNEMVSTVDGKIVQEHHGSVNKVPLIMQPNGGANIRSYEQHVETRTENKTYLRPPPVPENEAVHHHEHVFHGGSNFCAECGFEHNPNALRLLHPRSEYGLSSHDNSFEHSAVQRVRGVESFGYEPRMATSMQALHLLHPRSRPVSRAGSLDMGNRKHVLHSGNTRVARSEIGASYGTQGGYYGPNIVDLRRPRHFDRAYYYPSNQNTNVYFTEKGSSVI